MTTEHHNKHFVTRCANETESPSPPYVNDVAAPALIFFAVVLLVPVGYLLSVIVMSKL